MSTTIRVTDETKRRIRELAETTGRQMQDVVGEAISDYERKLFWERTNERFAELRRDPDQWEEIVAEREEWSGTLADGLD